MESGPASRSARARNKRGEGDRLRSELVAGASRLLEKLTGENALSLRAVAREAGVAAPSIYLHFKDKHTLVEAVLAERFAELRHELNRASEQHRDPAAALRARCLAYCDFAETHPGNYHVMFSAAADPLPEPATLSRLQGREVFQDLVDAVARCHPPRDTATTDPFATAVQIWTGLHGIATLRASRPSFPWPTTTHLIDRMLSAYCAITPSR